MKFLKLESGFSLIEVILSVVILSVGLIAINRTLLNSLSVLGYSKTRSEAERVASNKIWEIQSLAIHQNIKPEASESGELLAQTKTFSYNLLSAPAGGMDLLREVRLQVKWPESGRIQGLKRAFYVLLPTPKKD